MDRHLLLSSEEPVASTKHRGKCDIAVCIEESYSFLLGVVEAKEQDFDQGRAQVVLQLVAVAEGNAKRGVVASSYVGVVTNADRWVRVRAVLL